MQTSVKVSFYRFALKLNSGARNWPIGKPVYILDNQKPKDSGYCYLLKLANSFYVVGDVPCIVSSGEGGFIPVRFPSGSTVQMSGHSKLNT